MSAALELLKVRNLLYIVLDSGTRSLAPAEEGARLSQVDLFEFDMKWSNSPSVEKYVGRVEGLGLWSKQKFDVVVLPLSSSGGFQVSCSCRYPLHGEDGGEGGCCDHVKAVALTALFNLHRLPEVLDGLPEADKAEGERVLRLIGDASDGYEEHR